MKICQSWGCHKLLAQCTNLGLRCHKLFWVFNCISISAFLVIHGCFHFPLCSVMSSFFLVEHLLGKNKSKIKARWHLSSKGTQSVWLLSALHTGNDLMKQYLTVARSFCADLYRWFYFGSYFEWLTNKLAPLSHE